ncbi:TAXI family TRAP transporter solute-binding subunit [Kitasatospora aureofaciens]|uniref:TAXI family TRAP transporter solute-binding subunit n=1 Tax=Kitasatospora aureofaciens TaxID=1894 RepID=UPI001C451559|nr:TAXI family TRAP transporter solute-binding subunit [Kitasatospora aureofaciens]MBV6702081.1 TAXI family TRAP transporter solute-binding subunit [Kitasatospora aureofaciens]
MAPTTSPRLGAALRTAARSPLWRTLLVLVLLVAGLGGWWLSAGRSPGYPRGETRFATGVKLGVYDRYGQLLQTHVAKSMPGVRLALDNTQGSLDNLQRVTSGQDQFAIATADAVADYQGPGKDRLRAIARLYDDYLQLIVPASSPVLRTADLKGLRVGVGQPQSGVNLVTRRLLLAAGLDPDHDITPAPLGLGDAADALRKGNLDAFFWSGGLPTSALTDLSDHVRIRVVPLGDLAEALHKAEGGGTDAYRAATMPKGTYPNAEPKDAVATVAVPNLLITRDDVDPGLVEGMTRAVIDSRDQIGAQVHAAQLVDLRTAVYTDPLPLHEGAMRYYRSVKP